MCTFFTLAYKCGHTQTSHRCPRSTVYVYGPNGEQVPQLNGCDEQYCIGNNMDDNCIDCKMQDGHMPGVTTGVDKWSIWGPKEEGIAARMRRIEDGLQEMNSPLEVGEAQVEGWEDQVRAVLTDQKRGELDAPDTMTTSSMGSGTMPVEWPKEVNQASDLDEENDDWMWGGMKEFGGEDTTKSEKNVAMLVDRDVTVHHRSKRLKT